MSGRNKQKKRHIKRVNDNTLLKKNRDGSFYIFGKKAILEQIKSNPTSLNSFYVVNNSDQKSSEITNIVDFAKKNKIRIEYINEKTAILKVGKVNIQGIIAGVEKYKYYDSLDWEISFRKKKKPQLVLVLDRIEDVGNFGAIIRTAVAVGVSAIFVSGDNQAPVNGTVFKTSAGNISKVKIIKTPNVNQIVKKLKELKFWTYALDMPKDLKKGDLWNQKFDSHTALVLGGEGKGVSIKVKENCDFITAIPMANDVESLNVSVSGAIVMYEWKRQNR